MYTKEIWVLRNDSPCSPSDNPLWLHYLGQRVTNFYPCWWTSAVAEPSLLAERLSFSWAWYSKTVSQDWSGNKIYANMLATSQWDPLRPVWRHQLSYGLRGTHLTKADMHLQLITTPMPVQRSSMEVGAEGETTWSYRLLRSVAVFWAHRGILEESSHHPRPLL